MRAVEKLLGLFFLLYVAALIMLRNMVYIVSIDHLLTYRYFHPWPNHQSVAERVTPDKRESSSTARRRVNVLDQPIRPKNSLGNSSQVINRGHQGRGVNKSWDLKGVEKNHTLLKANTNHVGEIMKQHKAESHLVKLTKPHPQPVKMTKPHSHSVEMTKPHPQSFTVAKPHPFRYVINSPKVCGKYEVFLLVYILTAPDHYKRRTDIRQTWGNMLQYTDPIRVVFFMGVTNLGSELNSTSTQKALYFEQGQYQDLVQEDFLDTYRNLTHKGVSALKWITHNCRQATFVMKTDDDIFVNMFSLMRHLKRMQGRGIEYTQGLLMGSLWYNASVQKTGKWMITKGEWNGTYYPTYCLGLAYIFSTDVVEKLYKISYHVPFFWVEDVYITGFLPLKAGNITHKQFKSTYVLNGARFEELFTGPSWFLYIFAHLPQYLGRIQAVWQKMSRMAREEVPINIEEALQGEVLKGIPTHDRKFMASSQRYLRATAKLGEVPKVTYVPLP